MHESHSMGVMGAWARTVTQEDLTGTFGGGVVNHKSIFDLCGCCSFWEGVQVSL